MTHMLENFRVIAGAGGDDDEPEQRTPKEAPDSLRSRAMIGVLDLLGEGEIGGLVAGARSIYLNGTPLQNDDGSYNFKGITWDARKGTQSQEPISGLTAVEAPYYLGSKVTKSTPRLLSINNPDTDMVRVIVSTPTLMEQNVKTGDINGSSVSYELYVSTDGGAFTPITSDIAWTLNSGTWATESGILTATRAVDKTCLSATVGASVTGGDATGSITVQPQFYNGSSWVNHGPEVTIRISRQWVQEEKKDSKTGEMYFTGNASYQFVADRVITVTRTDAQKIRFNVVSKNVVAPDLSWPGVDTSPADIVLVQKEIKSGTTSTTFTIKGKTRSKYQRAHTISLPKPATSWQIRMNRITDDSGVVAVQNDIYLDSYVEIVNSRLSYPNSALVGIKIDSSGFNQIPSRAYLVDGLIIRIPSNYNPITRAYTGIWDGTFTVGVSDNPAWILFDLLTQNRYGLGQFIEDAQIDKAMLYQIGRYCDELVPDGYGGMEPRFTLNTVVQTQAEAYKLIVDICSVFRGMAYWNGEMVGLTQDAPADTEMIYNASNVVDGAFNYTGTARRDRHSVVLVTWNDPQEKYQQKIEYVEDTELIAKHGVKKTDVVAFGCTSRGQANRVGRWMLYTEKYESNFITFKVGVDSAYVLPGHVIEIQDQYRAGKRLGGRLVSATTTSATLDAPVTLAASGAVITVRLPDGTIAERTLLQGAGTYSTVTWTTALADIPLTNGMWVISEPNLQTTLARVISVAQDGAAPNQFIVTSVEHNPSKYAAIEQGLRFEDRDTYVKTNIIPADPPSDLVIEESTYVVSPSSMGIRATLSWTGVASWFVVRWRRFNGNWEARSVSDKQIIIDGLAADSYEFEVTSYNSIGIPNEYSVSASHDFTGKDIPPSDVQGFTVQVNGGLALFRWGQVSNTDLAGYEIRYAPVGNTNWDNASTITVTTRGTQVTTGIVPPGHWTFMIKAKDLTGNSSVNAAMCDAVIQNPNGVIWSREEINYWEIGTITNAVIHGPTRCLVPRSQALATDAGWSVFDEFVTQPFSESTYEMPVIDLGITGNVRTYGILISELGPGEGGLADPDILLKYKDANNVWSGYQPWDVGFLETSAIQMKVVMDNLQGLCSVSKFTPTVDVEVRYERGQGVAVSVSGASVTFSKSFFEVPNITPSIVSAGALIYEISAKSESGFTIKLYDSTGAATSGVIDWQAFGY